MGTPFRLREDRAGRSAGTTKTECGIHLSGLDALPKASAL
jgi:hypothetical protein